MHKLNLQAFVVFLLVGCLTNSLVAESVIGVARANGSFRADQSRVWGTSTLFEGTTIETARVGSRLELASGARVWLDAESQGEAHRDRMVLGRGSGQLENTASYQIEVRGLRVSPVDRTAAAQVALDRDHRVLVAALRGPVRVTTVEGILVANVRPGKTLVFDSQAAGAAAPTKVTGLLEKKDNRYFLTDETTNVTVELVGEGLEDQVGQRLEVTGVIDPAAKPAAPANYVIKVSKLARLGGAGAAGGGTGGWTALSIGAKTAIIVGVGAGAGFGIAAAAGAFREEKKQPVSAP